MTRNKLILITVAVFLILLVFLVAMLFADDCGIDVWVLCQPGHIAYVLEEPSDGAESTGQYYTMDCIRIDGAFQDGYAHCDKGWISVRNIVTDKPEWDNGRWYIVNENTAAWSGFEARKPGAISGGTRVQVFWKSSEWCVTNRGMIRTKDLEVEQCLICNN